MDHITALVDSSDCRVPRHAMREVVDSACYQLVFGLIRVRDSLIWLGALNILMSAMMYILWLRMTEYVAMASFRKESLTKEQCVSRGSGGQRLVGEHSFWNEACPHIFGIQA